MAVLIVDHLNKKFGGLVAVDDVSIEVEGCERVGLIGPNGSGKTTLFNCITGFLKADAGKVVFDGSDITNRPSKEVNHLGMNRTFQIPRPFPTLTVYENVAVARTFGRREGGRALRADEVIEFVGLEGKKGAQARSLNVAERKLVDLARALVTDPKLLLVDEIVAGLTDSETRDVAKLLIQLNEERKITLLVVEHVMRFIKDIASRVYVLDYGRKIFEGRVEEALNDDAVIKAYLGERIG